MPIFKLVCYLFFPFACSFCGTGFVPIYFNYATFKLDNAYTFGIAGGRDGNNDYVDHIEYYSFEESVKFAATFLVTVSDGTPVPNAEIQVAGSTIYTDESGSKAIFLENGTYDYTAQFEGVATGGTFTIDGGSEFIEAELPDVKGNINLMI